MTPRRIGLLGGSFNPAHAGHLHISEYALRRLGVDEVWWLVSPRNPLKSPQSLAAYAERLASARMVVRGNRRIRVLDIEAKQGLRYSWQTVAWLKRRYPYMQFVWLMGADNLAQFHRWRRWAWLLRALPIVVFDRAPYSHKAQRSKAFHRSRRFLLKANDIDGNWPVPSLAFIHLRRHGASSTELRKNLENPPF